jgi:hypothetical protein
MVTLTTPMYLASAADREMEYFFFLNQEIGLEPKLRVYLDVDLRSMLSLAQSKFVNPMRSNA